MIHLNIIMKRRTIIRIITNIYETFKLIIFEFPTVFENEHDVLIMFLFHVISKFRNCTILIAYVRTGLCLFKDLENQKGDFLILFITIKLSEPSGLVEAQHVPLLICVSLLHRCMMCITTWLLLRNFATM